MKLLLDANLSPEVGRLLKEAGHDAIHVRDVGLLSAPDPEILRSAAEEERILVTADADFGALLALGSLASPSVLLLRSADHLRPSEQADLIAANLPSISTDLERGAIASLTRIGYASVISPSRVGTGMDSQRAPSRIPRCPHRAHLLPPALDLRAPNGIHADRSCSGEGAIL